MSVAGRPVRYAVTICASQKGLTIAVPVLSMLALHSDTLGISAVSCVFCHLTQTVIDFAVVANMPGLNLS